MSTPLITIFVRHSPGCKYAGDEFNKRCACPKHLRWTLNGEQYRRTARARTWAEAERTKREVEDQLSGAPPTAPEPKRGVTIRDAVAEWLKMREQNGKQNAKGSALGAKLIEWAGANSFPFVTDITPSRLLAFRGTLPYRSGDSSSLKVHWSVVGGFFLWCKGMGYVEHSPAPSGKENPQFAIRFKKREVQPPTSEQVDKVLSTATGRVKLLAQLMRWSGMAISDAMRTKPEGNLYRGKRKKTGERFRVRVPQWLADNLQGVNFDVPTWKSPLHYWEREFTRVFNAAGVPMTPHHFRHYRVTELLASGVRVDDVALMVGTSPAEIRKTYQHWIKETEDRLDAEQEREFIGRGLTEKGNHAAN